MVFYSVKCYFLFTSGQKIVAFHGRTAVVGYTESQRNR